MVKCFFNLSDHTVCETIHAFSTKTGSSLRVLKRCAVPTDCTNQHVGCRDTENSSEKVGKLLIVEIVKWLWNILTRLVEISSGNLTNKWFKRLCKIPVINHR